MLDHCWNIVALFGHLRLLLLLMIWNPPNVDLLNDYQVFNLISYDDRCARLGIDRLELRRLRADLILCYKILHGLVLLSSDDFFTIVRNRATRGHSYKLFLPESRVDCRKRFLLFALLGFGTRCPTTLFLPTHCRCLWGG